MSPWVLTLATVHSVTPFTRGNEENDKHALPQSSLLSLKPREDLHLLTAVSQMDACPHPVLSAQEDNPVCLCHTQWFPTTEPGRCPAWKYLLNVAQFMSDLHVEAPNKCTKMYKWLCVYIFILYICTHVQRRLKVNTE